MLNVQCSDPGAWPCPGAWHNACRCLMLVFCGWGVVLEYASRTSRWHLHACSFVLAASGDTSLPSSLFTLTPGGAIQMLLHSASFTCLCCSSVAVFSTVTSYHSITWPFFQACSTIADRLKFANLTDCLVVFFHSWVGCPSSFADVVVATKAFHTNTIPLLSPSCVGSFTLVRRKPRERLDLKAVLILYCLSTHLISSLRHLEYGMMVVAIGLSAGYIGQIY